MAFEELEIRLDSIKDTVQTLDDWLEEIYCLTPLVKYTLVLHREIKSISEEIKKKERFIDEVSADIYAIFSLCLTMGVFLRNNNVWTMELLPKTQVPQNQLRSLKRKMSYRYRARVVYPKFWFEEAMLYLTGKQKHPSSILDEFSHQHLTSIVISYNLEQAHRRFKGFG